MKRTNRAGKSIVVDLMNERALIKGKPGYEAHCFGCQRSSKALHEQPAHTWADQHARTCSVG